MRGQLHRIFIADAQIKIIGADRGAEIELFKIDLPEFGISEIKEACFEKRKDIEYVVNKLKREYVREEEFAWDTSDFMESYKFKEFRQTLGMN